MRSSNFPELSYSPYECRRFVFEAASNELLSPVAKAATIIGN